MTDGRTGLGVALVTVIASCGPGDRRRVVPAGLLLRDLLRDLAAGRTVLFYDMRGRGQSSAVDDTSRVGIRDDVR